MDKRVLNKPGIYKPIPVDGINIATYKNYPYFSNPESKLQSVSDKPVYRYAKNYTFNKIPYSICMITLDSDAKSVEAFFDAQSKKLPDHIKGGIKTGKDGLFGIEFAYLVESYKASV